MKVAMIGLGKLGLPVSCAMVSRGHQVWGCDTDGEKAARYRRGVSGLHEPGLDELLARCLEGGLRVAGTLAEAVGPAEIVFVAVPTPSPPELGGAFDTSYVATALRDVAEVLRACDGYKVVAVISTVLPGTMRGEFLPLLEAEMGEPPGGRYGLCYNAQFIAMGTVVNDMLYPEFCLVGEYDRRSGDVLERFYRQLVETEPVLRMSMENAEIVKMIYNTFIGMKIVFANTAMELCDMVPHADCDVVSDAIGRATDRLISRRYLRGGMGDGGGCHPRDQRALAWLGRKLGLSANPFEFVTQARLLQTDYLAGVVKMERARTGLPVAVMGLTFKPETNLTTDSPSLLLIERLREAGIEPRTYDPIVEPTELPDEPHVYVLATWHKRMVNFPFAPGSVIIDVWRMLDEAPEGCELRAVGRGPEEGR